MPRCTDLPCRPQSLHDCTLPIGSMKVLFIFWIVNLYPRAEEIWASQPSLPLCWMEDFYGTQS